jgi:hypothetical protein
LSTHVVLVFALLVAVAAPVGGVPGTRQLDWHAAACELQVIMQFVVAELCASRILPAANAKFADAAITSAAKRMLTPRMTASQISIPAS